MKKLISSCVAVVAVLVFSLPAWAKGDDVYFGYKSADLTANTKSKLDQMALDLKHLKSVTLTAYVSDAGDPQLNQEFATKRVEAVKNYLVSQGVPASVISTQTLSGPASKARLVNIGYEAPSMAARTPAPPAYTPPPAPKAAPTPPPPPPPAAQPAPSQPSQPVITAKPEKKTSSGIEEMDISNEAYTGDEKTNVPPSRWEY